MTDTAKGRGLRWKLEQRELEQRMHTCLVYQFLALADLVSNWTAAALQLFAQRFSKPQVHTNPVNEAPISNLQIFILHCSLVLQPPCSKHKAIHLGNTTSSSKPHNLAKNILLSEALNFIPTTIPSLHEKIYQQREKR